MARDSSIVMTNITTRMTMSDVSRIEVPFNILNVIRGRMMMKIQIEIPV